jgi:spore coat polysaccharide biosynthesis predicted glycosyltransferase SpsG
MSTRRLVLAAEAAASTGLGHFVRCCALGDAAARRGWEVTVVLRPDALEWARAQVRSRGWALASGELEPEELGRAIGRGGRPDAAVLVIDSYLVDQTCFSRMRARAGCLVVVDDVADRYLDADIVVNQNLGADALPFRLGPGTRLLAGPAYALLRPEFPALRQGALDTIAGLPDVPGRVLVMMGGTDPTGSAGAVARACLAAFPEAAVDVVLPGAVRPRTAGRLTELPRLQDVAPRMLAADLVVTAAGSTVWEVCCLARPAAALEVAGNQRDVYGRLVSGRLVLGLGRAPVDEAGVVAVLRSLAETPGELRRLAGAAAKLVDGQGADRVLAWAVAASPEVRRQLWKRPAEGSP